MKLRIRSIEPAAIRVFASLALVVLAISNVTGCDDGALGSRSSSCRDFCAKLEQCDDRTDVAGCEAQCNQQPVRSDEYLAARAGCAEARSCNTFAAEIGNMGEDLCGGDDNCILNDCTSDTLASRARTSLEQTYCESIANKLNACDSSVTQAQLTGRCLELVPTLSSEYLDLVQGCIQGDCSQVRECLRSVADRYNTDVTPAPADWLDLPRK